MRAYDVKKTQYTVADFLSWQRDFSLDISPAFQRRSVWKPEAKSYFLDTVVRGLPAPIIYLRQRIDLSSQKAIREVVDGQQRLRTLFAYIDREVLSDYRDSRDGFSIRPVHNKSMAGLTFKRASTEIQHRILSYEFSTHVLPVDVEDREVLEMFARLNATGVKLSHQELRNAEYFGEFKSSMFGLALEQLDRWREWRIFTDDQISRMKEVELTSDICLNMIKGLNGKTQAKLNSIYKEFDEQFDDRSYVENRFRTVMEEIESLFGRDIRTTVFSSEVHFFSLFIFVYDSVYGLGSNLKEKSLVRLQRGIKNGLLEVSHRFETQEVPKSVLDAVQRASSDLGRRRTRLKYMRKICNA